MGDNRARRLLRTAKRAAYLAVVAPAVGRLPAALSYRMACWRGDWHFRCQAGKRTEMARNLRLVLGDELSPAAAQQVTREWFRLGSCGAVDLMRLRRGTQPLRRLVKIRGREHLAAALAAGKGAIVCTGHFHSRDSGFSVLHASGFPVTTIGRRVVQLRHSAFHPPNDGSGSNTSGRYGAIGSGRISSHGLAGPRSRRWQLPRSVPMRW